MMNRDLLRLLLVFFLAWLLVVAWEARATEPQVGQYGGARGWAKR